MRWTVLLLGAYGLFGSRIAARLAREPGWHVLLAGRDLARAEALAARCRTDAGAELVPLAIDAHGDNFDTALARERPQLVIHCAGPFQGQGYTVARRCLAAGAHYLDLADGRDHVVGFGPALDATARERGLLAVTGASTVPGLSAAVVDAYRSTFARLDGIDIGISPGNRTERGLATVAAILSYVGRPLPWREQGRGIAVRGWQRLQRHRYPQPVGARWLAACDVPDLAVFPERYGPLVCLRFRAGLELRRLHFGVWLISWLVRAGLVRDLSRHAATLKHMSEWFAGAGSDTGAMHVTLDGVGAGGGSCRLTWEIVARDGDGPEIPATAAVVVARKLARGEITAYGARACMDLFTLDEFLESLTGFAIDTYYRITPESVP
ncbi:MAG TPA: saccharopine dehydrogenase NADP-binding domain-containing protein [Tahibacter sp.]|uniref:saccharopine dehydrogenase family protein n=1 Tax=Tahibacter sp. TaxID=2056211 RepID=UPI002BAC5F47|nr:saccharopine dehydrogenase NADP-binding domain-containing protein [Tahibacter sp.]HSX61834.1 saccharopine dehydrogenase NADP-binding domain-containing protein [Tahibacter sp.]